MKLSNNKIFNYYQKLESAFNVDNKYFPAKINFYIQKNKNILYNLSLLIEQTKNDIAQQYGIYQEETDSYFIPLEQRNIAQQELNDLMNIEQEVGIIQLNFLDIEKLEFTPNQMEAILFMIKEDEGEE